VSWDREDECWTRAALAWPRARCKEAQLASFTPLTILVGDGELCAVSFFGDAVDREGEEFAGLGVWTDALSLESDLEPPFCASYSSCLFCCLAFARLF
jgi:hypothetical protein